MKFLAKLRMGYCYQRLGSSRRRFPTKVSDPILGNDILSIGSWIGGGSFDLGNDARDSAFARGRVGGKDRFATLRWLSATHEIQLAAGRAVLLAHDRFGIDLAVKSDLEERADRND